MPIFKFYLSGKISCLVIILLIVFISGCGREDSVNEKEIIRPVKFFKINMADRDINVEYPGVIKAAQEVYMAFEVSGKIDQFSAKEGLRVEKGTVLSRLDGRDFKIVKEARMADLNAAKADYERARELYENNTISKRDLDVARRNYEVAEAGVKTAQKSLDDTKLIAPFSGLVARTLVENFQNIKAKEPVLIFQDDSSLEMKVDIPERDYSKLDKTISLLELTQMLKPQIEIASFPGKRFKATFKEASTTADPVTRTFEITLSFAPPSNISILPGMTAHLAITGTTQKDNTKILIPAGAILSDDDKQAIVWLIDPKSNKVKSQSVEIGEMSGEIIEIEKGLKTGDIIAVSGVHQLREGMIVRKYEKP